MPRVMEKKRRRDEPMTPSGWALTKPRTEYETNNELCFACFYFDRSVWSCDYMLRTGHRRPCKAATKKNPKCKAFVQHPGGMYEPKNIKNKPKAAHTHK